jgi:hypothetical protein
MSLEKKAFTSLFFLKLFFPFPFVWLDFNSVTCNELFVETSAECSGVCSGGMVRGIESFFVLSDGYSMYYNEIAFAIWHC